MGKFVVRKTKIVYVENDPTLRGFMEKLLNQSNQLEVVGSFQSAKEALNDKSVRSADAALLDYSLEQDGLNGVELGIALRNMNEHLAIVIYSQFSVRPMVARVPKELRSGWSFFDKSATMQLEEYVSIIKQTLAGKGNWEEVMGSDSTNQESEASAFFSLTPRQRSIMALASEGANAQDISAQLDMSYAYVRKELSRAYKILLPNVDDTADLRTAAVLRYLELLRL